MTSAFYTDTLIRIKEATKGAATDEQRNEVLLALAKVISIILMAKNNKEYNIELIEKVTLRVLDVNLEPTIVRQVEGVENYYTETYKKIIDGVRFTSDDEVYTTLCALAAVMSRILIAYKSKDLDADEKHLFNVMYRILEVNTE
jgi:hypothetical protein